MRATSIISQTLQILNNENASEDRAINFIHGLYEGWDPAKLQYSGDRRSKVGEPRGYDLKKIFSVGPILGNRCEFGAIFSEPWEDQNTPLTGTTVYPLRHRVWLVLQ